MVPANDFFGLLLQYSFIVNNGQTINNMAAHTLPDKKIICQKSLTTDILIFVYKS
jgi:hypothetical protein